MMKAHFTSNQLQIVPSMQKQYHRSRTCNNRKYWSIDATHLLETLWTIIDSQLQKHVHLILRWTLCLFDRTQLQLSSENNEFGITSRSVAHTIKGRRVTMPEPRGKKSRPTKFSRTLLLPLLCLTMSHWKFHPRSAYPPTTTICGKSSFVFVRVKISWSLLIVGISYQVKN